MLNVIKLFITDLWIIHISEAYCWMQCLIFTARCLFQNMIQFNGFCGCPYCYAPGESVQTSDRGHTLTYPLNCENPNEHLELFTHLSNTRNGPKESKRL